MAILNDNKNKCFYCERPFNDANYGTNRPCARTRDHIIPLSKKGTNHVRNMVHCCIECNGVKCSLTLEAFIEKINTHIQSGIRIKTIPQNRLHLIVANATLLIGYVKKEGKRLYRHKNDITLRELLPKQDFPTIHEINKKAKKPKIRKSSIVGDYLKRHAADVTLSVNTNTNRQSREELLFLQSQTPQQFELTKKYGWSIAKVLSEPEPNFHYE